LQEAIESEFFRANSDDDDDTPIAAQLGKKTANDESDNALLTSLGR
jgi:hypothetical protein